MRFDNHWYLVVVLMLHLYCCNPAPYVWVESFPSSDHKPQPYKIHAGDQIEVAVWDQTQVSGTYRVRQDGYITVPLVGELAVAGITPDEASDAIEAKLEGDIVQNVSVVVISREIAPQFVSVIGEVEEPGQFELKPGDTIIDALARAGGLTEFADEESIYVFRGKAPVLRVRFDYNRLTTTKTGGIQFSLQSGDAIIVE